MEKRFWIILAVVVAAMIGFFIVTGEKKNSADDANTSRSNNVYGKADSKVTLTEFVDFQCEACYAFYPVVKEVKELYKDKVRFEIRNFPISSSHQFSMQAARNAEAAAKQGKFFEMHDKIFEGQKMWEQTQNPQQMFDQYAEEIGLNMDQFRKDLPTQAVNDAINGDLKAVKEIGGTGTPTFTLNGKKLEQNPQTKEGFIKLLDDALKESEKQ
ncbi:MAG TPA: thioredoxin domain-containing protein [Candidatus Saccharibacteria bacterium]|nr:thioredoxin domain-containing protein [Candidatus Saccharibacteria bacterium]